MSSGRKVAGVIRSLECATLMHENLLVPVLMCRNDTVVWRDKEISRIQAVQVDNFRDLLGIKRTYRMPNV